MELTLYNTLSRKRETFHPIEEGKLRLYACGVTTYDVCHIGHGMQAIIYDVVRNFFEHMGYEVTYVRNYTDVDDKIIAQAQAKGISALEHSESMIAESINDMTALGVRPATLEPKVSEHIPEIIETIERIIARGGAYPSEGDVYFKVAAHEGYGKLSNRNPVDMRAGSRLGSNSKKKDPLDFALWKAAKPGEVSWPSPWGEGRPGWHIECSAMAIKHLGVRFDIHGGGKDLIFPHHENEVAQSEQATGEHFCNYWVHNGLVTVDGVKMSKSLGNFMSIRDALKLYDAETIRYSILTHHYSSNIDFNEQTFYDAYSRLIYFYSTLQRIDEILAAHTEYPQTIPDSITPPDVAHSFKLAMCDDLNTPVAISEMGKVFRFLNDMLAAKKPKLKAKLFMFRQVSESLRHCMATLGLLNRKPGEALASIQAYLISAKKLELPRVEQLIADRNQARSVGDWTRADELRDALVALGITVMDGPDGTVWQVMP